ncbi:carbohydrate ABC transporter permease [Phytoactinopolyspora alkaliphila]|uniref:Carbohydrate ABC transporter permease n=2 Tax=Phytoactinopolyspora alkaliphila TaxID=1783498 RepID=A0A6N9YP53_9ACTN|nr:carbohydrate ABC transporter permease [Phytoactinopolyspora alkaliphila]
MLWLLSAPFDASPGLGVSWPSFTLDNFRGVFENPRAVTSLWNSLFLSVVSTVLVVIACAFAGYALSRVRIPGRNLILYSLMLFSAVVSGTATMVPTFLLIYELGLINTHTGVILILTGGMLPTALFILKDFMDSVPRSYEESAQVAGASSFQILKDIVVPVVRPGLAVIAVWALVNIWGDFLTPFILLRSAELYPAAVVIYNFYNEAGDPNLSLVSAFAFLYSIPVVLMYLFVNARYGFRFHGGIKR